MSDHLIPEPTITKEQARSLGLRGWNIACQVCGNFGISWVLMDRRNNALCPSCEETAHKLRDGYLNFLRRRFNPNTGERLHGR